MNERESRRRHHFDPGKVSVGGIGSTHGTVSALSDTRTVELAVAVKA